MEQQILNEGAKIKELSKTPVAEEELPPENLPLLPCHVCQRTFLPRPLKKHIPICELAARKKRKPFDSLKQRVMGTDMAPFFQKRYFKKQPEIHNQVLVGNIYDKKENNWKENHLALVSTIRAAKGVPQEVKHITPSSVKKPTTLGISKSQSNKRCPTCDRAFGPKAFERHVEWCKEQRHRLPKTSPNTLRAKERLEARINYRVPPLKPSQRTIIREKYSPVHLPDQVPPFITPTSRPTEDKVINTKKKLFDKNKGKIKIEHETKSKFEKKLEDSAEIKDMAKSFQTKRTNPLKKSNEKKVSCELPGITVSTLTYGKEKNSLKWKNYIEDPSSSSREQDKKKPEVINIKNIKTGTAIVTERSLMEKARHYYQKPNQRKFSDNFTETKIPIAKITTNFYKRNLKPLPYKEHIKIQNIKTVIENINSSSNDDDDEDKNETCSLISKSNLPPLISGIKSKFNSPKSQTSNDKKDSYRKKSFTRSAKISESTTNTIGTNTLPPISHENKKKIYEKNETESEEEEEIRYSPKTLISKKVSVNSSDSEEDKNTYNYKNRKIVDRNMQKIDIEPFSSGEDEEEFFNEERKENCDEDALSIIENEDEDADLFHPIGSLKDEENFNPPIINEGTSELSCCGKQSFSLSYISERTEPIDEFSKLKKSITSTDDKDIELIDKNDDILDLIAIDEVDNQKNDFLDNSTKKEKNFFLKKQKLWKRRRKLKKCRTCLNCFLRDFKKMKKNGKLKFSNEEIEESIEYENEDSIKDEVTPSNSLIDDDGEETEDSLESIIPKKKRRIYSTLTTSNEAIKIWEPPPLILNYDEFSNVTKSSANFLFINEMYSSSTTTIDKSEIDQDNDDDIRDLGDEEMKGWESETITVDRLESLDNIDSHQYQERRDIKRLPVIGVVENQKKNTRKTSPNDIKLPAIGDGTSKRIKSTDLVGNLRSKVQEKRATTSILPFLNNELIKIKSGGGGCGDLKKKNTKTLTTKTTKIKENVKNNVNEEKIKKGNVEKTSATSEIIKAEDLFPVDDEMYEEYKKYEEEYLKEKKTSNKKIKKKPDNFGINIEKRDKTFVDSAYSRKTEKSPSITTQEKPKEVVVSPGERMSKFCHECGNKYPVLSAKFCVECGVRRLVL